MLIKPSELPITANGYQPKCRCGKDQHLGECEDIKLLNDIKKESFELLKETLHLLYNEDETTLGEERNKMYLKIRRFIEKLKETRC